MDTIASKLHHKQTLHLLWSVLFAAHILSKYSHLGRSKAVEGG